MTACSHLEASFTNGRHRRTRCAAPRLPNSEYCSPHKQQALQRVTPFKGNQVVRELRWRFGVGSGVTV